MSYISRLYVHVGTTSPYFIRFSDSLFKMAIEHLYQHPRYDACCYPSCTDLQLLCAELKMYATEECVLFHSAVFISSTHSSGSWVSQAL